MAGIQKQPETPEPSVNGHKLSADFAAADIAAVKTLGRSDDREATRYLSAATQLDIGYARAVVKKVMNERFRALAPTFGIDVPVVTMWAIKALRTRAQRDYALAVLLTALLSSLLLAFLWVWMLIVALLVVIAVWLAVSWERWERTHNLAKMLRDRFDPDDAPPPQQEAECERLREVEKRRDGNLVVFSGHSAFVGSGKMVYHRRLVLNVSRGKETEDGSREDPEPFSSQDLHSALAEAFDHESGLAKNLNNIRIYERLFVNGLHIQKNPQLLPDPLCAPPTSVNRGLLSAAALHPSPEARTYVCVEMPGWQGQLVVTLFIRAVNAGGSLYVEYTFRVLPPLRAEFLWIDRFHELTVQRRLRHSLGFGILTMVRALLASPYWAIKTYRQPHAAQRRQLRQRSAIERGYVFDYGAQRSIREDACGTRRYHYFLAQDETMYILLAQQTLIRAVEKFLDDHGVDLDQFNDQVKIILDKSINVGNISDSSGVVIGDNSTAKVNDSAEEKK